MYPAFHPIDASIEKRERVAEEAAPRRAIQRELGVVALPVAAGLALCKLRRMGVVRGEVEEEGLFGNHGAADETGRGLVVELIDVYHVDRIGIVGKDPGGLPRRQRAAPVEPRARAEPHAFVR